MTTMVIDGGKASAVAVAGASSGVVPNTRAVSNSIENTCVRLLPTHGERTKKAIMSLDFATTCTETKKFAYRARIFNPHPHSRMINMAGGPASLI